MSSYTEQISWSMELNEEVVKFWLTKVEEWQDLEAKSNQILEMTQKLPDMANFLSELEKVLLNLEPRQLLSEYPSVPKLLHALLNNPMVLTRDNLHHLVMSCITAVAAPCRGHESEKDSITSKSVKWVKSQINHICASTPPEILPFIRVAEHLGLQPVELTKEVNSQLVLSLVKDLSDAPSREWNDSCRDFIPRCAIPGSSLRHISEMCLPIISNPVTRPLVEALLCCDVSSDVVSISKIETESIAHVEEALSPYFIDASKEIIKDWYFGIAKDTPLSYEARLAQWLRDTTFFQDEILVLLEICCKERTFISRNEMRKIFSVRDLPRALSENLSLFSVAFGILQYAIHETGGNVHVMRFWGTLLQLVNESDRQNKTLGCRLPWVHVKTVFEAKVQKINDMSMRVSQCGTKVDEKRPVRKVLSIKKVNDPFNFVNYASIWSNDLTDLINYLNIDWTDVPSNAFLYHAKKIQLNIKEICRQQEKKFRFEPYNVWLIVQGFPELVQRCHWAVVLESEEFVEYSLEVVLRFHAGGTDLDENSKSQVKHFINTLRLLKSKSQVVTTDILCAVDHIADVVNNQPDLRSLIRHLTMIFVFTSPSLKYLNLQDIFSKLTEELPIHYAFDWLLSWFEDSVDFQTKGRIRWLYEDRNLSRTSETAVKFLNLLHDLYKKFNDFVDNLSTDSPGKVHTNDLRLRFENVTKLLPHKND